MNIVENIQKRGRKMNKTIKRVLLVLMTLMLAILVLPVTELQAANAKIAKNMTVVYYPKAKQHNEVNITLSKIKVSKVKSSNSKALKVSTLKSDMDFSLLKFTPKRAGTSTVSFTAKTKSKTYTYTSKVKVVKYQNPFKTLKIGSKNYTSKFKNTDYPGWAFASSDKIKGRLNITAKKGWKVSKIELVNLSTRKAKKIKNKTKIDMSKKGVDRLDITMKNSKTGVTHKIMITR